MHTFLDFLWRLHPFEHFTDFCSSLIVVMTFFSMIYPPTRKKIKGFFTDRKNIKNIENYKETMEKRFIVLKNAMDQNKEANLTILHDRLFSECTRCINNGCVTFSQFDNITHIYEVYSKLGGNGTGNVLYKKVSSLPMVRDGFDIDDISQKHEGDKNDK
jgi:hypothetical protein